MQAREHQRSREGHRSPRFDDPLSWSVAVLRVGGVTIRLHAVMLGTILVLMVRSTWFGGSSGGVLGPGFSLALAVWFFWVPLAAEWTRAIVIRRLGGAASEVVLHPLGGLDVAALPPGWRRGAIASISGLGVVALIGVVAGVVVAGATGFGSGVAPPNPFNLDGLYDVHMAGHAWLDVVFLLEWTCVVVLVANCLPAPPMRAWQLLRAIGRARLGPARSHRLALRIGVAAAVALGIGGIVGRSIPVVLVALFCAVCLREEFQRLRVLRASLGHATDTDAMLHADSMLEQDEAESSALLRRQRLRRKKTADAQLDVALDRVLLKIAEHGREALDRREERILRRATRRREDQAGEAD